VDGIHDLGGMEGMGTVAVEVDEPVFHHDWERRALGMTMCTFVAGLSNGSQFRHSIERMDAVHYLSSSYYEHWITGVATRAVEAAVITRDELERRAGGHFPLSFPLASTGITGAGPTGTGAPFAVGSAVRVVDVTTRGHTRCPRYVRRRRGTVVRVDPPASLPDVDAHGDERAYEPIYTVSFSLNELWGPSAEEGTVHVDLWQSYLEPA
jgi:nitrile hydratase subunit beta